MEDDFTLHRAIVDLISDDLYGYKKQAIVVLNLTGVLFVPLKMLDNLNLEVNLYNRVISEIREMLIINSLSGVVNKNIDDLSYGINNYITDLIFTNTSEYVNLDSVTYGDVITGINDVVTKSFSSIGIQDYKPLGYSNDSRVYDLMSVNSNILSCSIALKLYIKE